MNADWVVREQVMEWLDALHLPSGGPVVGTSLRDNAVVVMPCMFTVEELPGIRASHASWPDPAPGEDLDDR